MAALVAEVLRESEQVGMTVEKTLHGRISAVDPYLRNSGIRLHVDSARAREHVIFHEVRARDV